MIKYYLHKKNCFLTEHTIIWCIRNDEWNIYWWI